MTLTTRHYPLRSGTHRLSGAALAVLIHLCALWVFVSLSSPVAEPEDPHLQTLIIQDVLIAPASPIPLVEIPERTVSAKPVQKAHMKLPPPVPIQEVVPEKSAPAVPLDPLPSPSRSVAVAAPPTPVATGLVSAPPTLTSTKPQIAVVAAESHPAAPATAVFESQFPATAAPARHYAPSEPQQSPVPAEVSRAAPSVPAPTPMPPAAAVAAQAPAMPPAVLAITPSVGVVAPRTAIDALCPPEFQVKPEMPVNLTDLLGDEWVVRANITIRNDTVTDIRIISGPKVFHDNVRKAIRQYRCKTGGGEVVATQTLRFKLP